jgi:hypothetical protein
MNDERSPLRPFFTPYPRFARAALVFCLLSVFVGPASAVADLLDRASDPVILGGAAIDRLLGVDPDRIVAFEYSSGWVQIPVQIDERVIKDYGLVYNSNPIGLSTLAYADAETFVGADPDPAFDGDDELVFMARDAGDWAPGLTWDPAGVILGSRVEIVVTDPLTSNTAYVYLFECDGSLVPGAGVDYVSYDFVLLSGDYLTTYNTTAGPNPEDSEVVTPCYRERFGDRWIRDETNVYEGGATGADILDRHKNLFSPGNCARFVWEMVTGAQGTLVHSSAIDTDIPGFGYSSYYLDDSTPAVTQCTGDAHAYGSSGPWVNMTIPNTDPTLGVHNRFVESRTVYFEPPNQTVIVAETRHDQATNSLLVTVSPPTAVETPMTPPRHHLAESVPNPFRLETRIRFEVPAGERTAVRIYDVSGTLITTLYEGIAASGSGVITWNGTGADSRRLPSGIYFCRLESGGFSQTRTVVLLD